LLVGVWLGVRGCGGIGSEMVAKLSRWRLLIGRVTLRPVKLGGCLLDMMGAD